jgi:hypothetical protein
MNPDDLISGDRGVPDQVGDVARMGAESEEAGIQLANKAFAKAIVVHEMGHVLHKTKSPEIFWAMKTEESAFLDWRDLAMEVSQYAHMNPMEYVAEVFTGRAYGFSYSPAVLSKYVEFGGP